MAFNFKRVVAYGCSFTAGQELGDSIVLGKPEDEVDQFKRKHGIHCIKEIYGDDETRARCTKLSSELSWPNYIAKKLGVECVNRAELGTSVNEFIFNIERDIATGQIHDDDLILVGMTSPVRFSWVADYGVMITKFVGDSRWTYNNELNDALLDTWATDCNLVWEYIKHARHLNLISKSLGGRLKMVMAVQTMNSIKNEFSGYLPHLSWIDNVELEHLLTPNVAIPNFNYHDYIRTTHGWGHPKVDIHVKFSEHVWSSLIANGIVNV